MSRTHLQVGLVLAVALAASGISVEAAVITTGDGLHVEDASSHLASGPRAAWDAINGNGLSGGNHNTISSAMWLSGVGDSSPYLVYDLGGNYALTTSWNGWNYNEGGGETDRSIQNVEILVSPDENPANFVKLNSSGGPVAGGANGTGDFLFPVASGAVAYPGFGIDLSSATNAALLNNVRLVKLNVLDNHGDPGFSGIAEIQFDGTLNTADSGLITEIAGVTVSAFSSQLAGREAANTTNGSGVLDTEAGAGLGAVNSSEPNMWLSGSGDPTPSIDFDLQSAQVLNHLHVFNYNEAGGEHDRGLNEVQILVSPDTNTANLVALDNSGGAGWRQWTLWVRRFAVGEPH